MNDIEKYQAQELTRELDHPDAGMDSKEGTILHLIKSILRLWYVVLGVFILIFPISAYFVWQIFVPLYTTIGYIKVDPVLIDPISGDQDKGNIANYATYLSQQAYDMKNNSQILGKVMEDLIDVNLSMFNNDENEWDVIKTALTDGTIEVIVPRNSQVVQVSMTSAEPRDSRLVVTAFLEAYIDVIKDNLLESEDKTIGMLTDQSEELKMSYEQQQSDLTILANEHGADSTQGLLAMMYEEQNILQEKITGLETRYLDLQVRETVLNDINDPNVNVFPLEMIDKRDETINNDPYVQSTTQVLVQYKQNLQLRKQQLSQDRPELVKMQELIEILQKDLESYRKEAGERFDANVSQLIKRTNKNDLALVQKELTLVKTSMDEYKLKIEKNSEDTLELRRLDWKIQDIMAKMRIDKEKNDEIQGRIKELRMLAKRPARINKGPAPVSGPPETKKYKMLAVAAFGSLALGLVLAFLIARSDKRIYSPEEVRKDFGIPVIGTTCDLSQVQKKLLPAKLAEDYKTIRANLDLLSAGSIPHKLVITSPGKKEGKSTFSVNIAKCLALSGKRVLLIDGDMQRPSIGRLLNLPNGSWGLQDVLFGLRSFEDTVRSDPLTGLDVLTADGRNSDEAIQLLEKPQAAECLAKISCKYDHVIIDTPPVLAAPDARFWARMADAVVLSTFIGQTQSPELKRTIEELSTINVTILGNVSCNVPMADNYYRYGYGYGRDDDHRKNREGNGKKKRVKKEDILISSLDNQ